MLSLKKFLGVVLIGCLGGSIAWTEPVSDPIPEATSTPALAPEQEVPPAVAGQDELRRQAQNPISSLISVPFQFQALGGIGPGDKTALVMKLQPVIPVALNEDWNLVNRAIIPTIFVPSGVVPTSLDSSNLNPQQRFGNSQFGLGDINYTAFFTPAHPGEVMLGVGPAISFPTATDSVLGSGKFALGPSVVAVTHQGSFMLGALATQQWSVAGDGSRPSTSNFSLQPFVNYNMGDGWYLTSSPIITANWTAAPQERWTVPIGGGFGRVTKIGDQPVNMTAQACSSPSARYFRACPAPTQRCPKKPSRRSPFPIWLRHPSAP